jgi:hypothetical protein
MLRLSIPLRQALARLSLPMLIAAAFGVLLKNSDGGSLLTDGDASDTSEATATIAAAHAYQVSSGINDQRPEYLVNGALLGAAADRMFGRRGTDHTRQRLQDLEDRSIHHENAVLDCRKALQLLAADTRVELDASVNSSAEAIGEQLDALKETIERLAIELDGVNELERKLGVLDKGLQDMQGYIVKAAEEAQQRRAATQGFPVGQEPTAERTAELNEMVKLMAGLPGQQEEFAARRRAALAANFKQPAGGGL